MNSQLMVAALLSAGLAASGCSPKWGDPALPTVPHVELPEVRPVHPFAAGQALRYPDADQLARDPFLTAVAQRDRRTALADARWRLVQATVRGLHAEVHTILDTPNRFRFRGKTYQEGDTIAGTDWVVVSIQESGIRLRSRDGSGSDYLPFLTDDEGDFPIPAIPPG